MGETNLPNMWHNSCGYDTTGACQSLDKSLYTPDWQWTWPNTGGRNGAMTRNTVTTGVAHRSPVLSSKEDRTYSNCPKEKGEKS